MKKLVVLLLATLVATSAAAVVDPDPDMMGIYFDVSADNNCYTATPNVPFFAYAIVTNTTTAGIDAYEFSYEMVVPVGSEGLLFRLANNIANGAASGVDVGESGPLGGDHIVGLATPLPASPAIIVHAWQYMLLGAFPVDVYLRAASVPSLPGGFPVVQGVGTGLMTVGQSTGGPEIPVATINGDCVVATEDASWGSVKSLYR
jgi:hypothetical protein